MRKEEKPRTENVEGTKMDGEDNSGKFSSYVPYDGSYSHLMGDLKPAYQGSQSSSPTKDAE